MATTVIGDEIDGTIRLRCIKGGVQEPRYTLADFRELAREYADERHCEAKLAIQLSLSCFCEWIAKRQRKEHSPNESPNR